MFADTNILIYAHDADAGIKRERAARQLRGLWDVNIGQTTAGIKVVNPLQDDFEHG